MKERSLGFGMNEEFERRMELEGMLLGSLSILVLWLLSRLELHLGYSLG